MMIVFFILASFSMLMVVTICSYRKGYEDGVNAIIEYVCKKLNNEKLANEEV